MSLVQSVFRMAAVCSVALACGLGAGAGNGSTPGSGTTSKGQPAPKGQSAAQEAVGTWWDRTEPPRGKQLPTSKHYRIRSDLPADQTQKWTKRLDQMYDEYQRRLVQSAGMRRRTPEILNVFLFARQKDYLDTLRTHFGVNAMGSGGMFFITPRGGGLAFFIENLSDQRISHVAQHEGFHQFANAFFGSDLPPWLNEGLAEFFGLSVVEGKTIAVGQAAPHMTELLKTAVEHEAQVPFTTLLRVGHEQWGSVVQAGKAQILYLQSWSMVHFLVYGEKGKYQGAFNRLLQMVNAGTPAWDAMRQSFGLNSDADVQDFESKWIEYVKAAKPTSYAAAQTRLEFLAEGLRTVWDAGQRPTNLKELRKALQDTNYHYDMQSHGYVMTLQASDDANFTIPQDLDNKQPITIEVVPAVPPKSATGKKLEEAHPAPPTIRTRGLQPKDVQVTWTRRADSPGEFDYDIAGR